jgi:hypothetical protein
MDLSGFQRALDRRTGIQLDPAAQTEFVNEAIQAIASERDWPWLDASQTITTVAGTATYALPTDWVRTRDLIIGGKDIRRIDIADADAYNYYQDRSWTWNYAINEGSIVIVPTPTNAQTVIHRYVKREPLLANATDTPLLASQYHGAVIAIAAALVCERMGDNRAPSFRTDYGQWFNRMRDATTRSREPMRVRVRPGAGW